ncbi:porin [Epibacterium ulvae]|uniref:porin n=1 Tax=Epibacterium ulvae TaxID=1156985 RepID=UPI001BFCBD0F|nr:porin [Epibacterium ulvae]MBT8153494.1 porin [Epibacterium ulvae]
MKKILFASTALIATAGVAAAEVSFGGYGRFGLQYNEGATGTEKETRLEQRFRLNITASAETDAGVVFGGRIRLQTGEENEGGAGGDGPGAAEFNVTYGGFRLDVGGTADLLDSGDVVKFYGYGVGLTAIVEQANAFEGFDASGFAGSSDTTAQKVKVVYSVGDFTVGASYTEDNEAASVDSYYQIGFGYDFGAVAAGALYGERDNAASESYWILGLSGDLGPVQYNLTVGESDGQDEVAYGLSAAYAVSSATTLTAVVADSGDDAADTVFGLGFNHGLGGGVSLRGGVGQNTGGDTEADLGVRFDF